MKQIVIINVMMLLLSALPALAELDCKVIEYGDHQEVDCTGQPLTKEEQAIRDKENAKLERERKAKELVDSILKNAGVSTEKEPDITVDSMENSTIEHYSSFTKMGFKFRAYNPGKAKRIRFKIILFNSKDFETQSFYAEEFFGEGESKTVTKTELIFSDFSRWQVKW